MRKRLIVVVGLVLMATRGHAQNACALLTAGDIQATVGVQAGPPNRLDTPVTEGPMKGTMLYGCSWTTGTTTVSASIMPAAAGAARDSGLAVMQRATEALLSQHWTQDKRDFPNGTCSVLAPPADQAATMPTISQCYLERGPRVVAVALMRPGTKPTLAQMKALLDHAVGHL